MHTTQRRLGVSVGLAVVLLVTGCAKPASTGGPPSPGPRSSDYAVTGTVNLSPACPGPVSLGSPCPDRPLADAKVAALQGDAVVASTVTDAAGHYRLTLRPGTYQIVATGTSGIGKPAVHVVSVPPDTVVDLTVDSGMR